MVIGIKFKYFYWNWYNYYFWFCEYCVTMVAL